MAALAVGIAQGALDEALNYAKRRRQFGKPILEYEAIQWMLADMATEIEARPAAGVARRDPAGRRQAVSAHRLAGEAVLRRRWRCGPRRRPSRFTADTDI